MDKHARLSFSASERWLRCPASVPMSEGIPDRSSSAAEEGTFAHVIMERTLIEWQMLGLEPVVQSFTFPDDLDTSTWESPEIMRGHVQKCVDYIVDEYNNFPGDNVRLYTEQKVDLQYMTGRDDTWGTCDVRIESDDHIAVYDLKYGAGIFVKPDTSQNRLYLLGAMCETLRETKGIAPWELCYGMIMQPRYPGEDGEIFRGVEMPPQELMDWFDEEVKPAMGLTDNPPAPKAGDWCQFCRVRATCPAAQAKVAENLPFEPQLPDVTGISIQPSTVVENKTIDELIQIHDNIPFINGYLKAVSEHLRKLLDARDPRLEGRLKLVVSRRNTVYTQDEDVIMRELVAGKGRTVKDGYIPKKTFIKEKPLSASQMLKLKLNDAQKAKLQQYISKTEGSLAIVPWSDPRDNACPPIPFEDQAKVALPQPFDFL